MSRLYLSINASMYWVLSLLFVYRYTLQGWDGLRPDRGRRHGTHHETAGGCAVATPLGFGGVALASPLAWIRRPSPGRSLLYRDP